MELLGSLTRLCGPVVVSSLPEFLAMRALPHPFMEAVRIRAAQVRRMHQRVTDGLPDVHLVDVRAAVGREFVGKTTNAMSADLFHPSAFGYARIADALAPDIIAVLAAESRKDSPDDNPHTQPTWAC